MVYQSSHLELIAPLFSKNYRNPLLIIGDPRPPLDLLHPTTRTRWLSAEAYWPDRPSGEKLCSPMRRVAFNMRLPIRFRLTSVQPCFSLAHLSERDGEEARRRLFVGGSRQPGTPFGGWEELPVACAERHASEPVLGVAEDAQNRIKRFSTVIVLFPR